MNLLSLPLRRVLTVLVKLSVLVLLVLVHGEALAAPAKPFGSQQLVRLINNRMGILVSINGKGPFLFCLDTGTSKTVLTPALRDQIGLTPLPGAPVDVVTAAGRTKSAYYKLAEVAAAGVIVEGENGVVVELPKELGVMGALGGDFLSNFTVDLNFRALTVTLYPHGSVAFWAGFEKVKGRFDQHGIIIAPALVDSVSAEVVLDTGAQSTVANSRLAFSMRATGIAVQPYEQQIGDSQLQRLPAWSLGSQWIRLGPAAWNSRQILVSDMPGFDELGLGQRPAIFVGMDLLLGRRIILDFGSGAIWLKP